ncbi:MAG: oligoendopeptidase F [Bacillota bacterium]
MNELKKRDEIELKYKWKLEDIIADENHINKVFDSCREKLKKIQEYKGKLNKENTIECLVLTDLLSVDLEKIFVYTHMKRDENTADSKYIELSEKVRLLSVEVSGATSFIVPELSRFKTKDLKEMQNSPRYKDYDIEIKYTLRNKKHLLSDREEKLLSDITLFSSGYKNVFQVFDNADLKFEDIEVDGEKVQVTHGMYSFLLQNPSQQVRRAAFESIYTQYKAYTNTLAANYSGNVNKNVFYARARKYSSSLEGALYSDAIDEKVYDNLIEAVRQNTALVHRYVGLRKRVLALEEYHMYDMYAPIVKDTSEKQDYDLSYDTIVEALSVLGDDYVKQLKIARENRWIDVEETQNKRSGAYSWGAYGVHPYVLLNHKGTMHDVFTISHEMGHALHSHYSNTAQPYSKAGYGIFLAEIASTVNEVLLLKYMLRTAKGEKRKYLLSYYLDMFRTTLFRQTMFAEFEKFAHASVEEGQPLSSDKLSEFYYELNKKYYGDEVIHDDYIKYEWSRIPHFYNAFYVYKYATGLTAAINIVRKILKKEEGFVDKYIEFLKSGGSDYPLKILEKTGINLKGKRPYMVAMNEFEKTLLALERMCK